jgi:curli biogenesis system outer membrane secretion channel CsgG
MTARRALSLRLALLAAGLFAWAASGCASGPGRVLGERPPSVAVWDLDDTGGGGDSLEGGGELLSNQVLEAFQEDAGFRVVERQKLLHVLEEQRLGSGELADETTRLRLGRLVGARYMVFGAYMTSPAGMRIDLRLVEVETGRVRKAVSKTVSGTDLSDGLAAAREAARELAKARVP